MLFYGMARLEGLYANSSDELFQTLSDWEEQLKHLDIPELSEGPEVGP